MKENINKLLFLDIETVGVADDLDDLGHTHPQLLNIWQSSGVDYFKRRYPEDSELSSNDLFVKRSALLPEFGKIVCVSVGFILDNGEIKLDSFYGEEKELLSKLSNLLVRIEKLDFKLCGHNIKNFDLPYIAKRMLINEIKIPSILPNYQIKPWETKVVDTKEVWNFNSFKGLSSLELVCASLNVPNPKDNEVNGSNMHNYYYNNNDINKIVEYCEEDVKATINLMKKLKQVW
jgi:DNA polymerase elongation subunit (family B)